MRQGDRLGDGNTLALQQPTLKELLPHRILPTLSKLLKPLALPIMAREMLPSHQVR